MSKNLFWQISARQSFANDSRIVPTEVYFPADEITEKEVEALLSEEREREGRVAFGTLVEVRLLSNNYKLVADPANNLWLENKKSGELNDIHDSIRSDIVEMLELEVI